YIHVSASAAHNTFHRPSPRRRTPHPSAVFRLTGVCVITSIWLLANSMCKQVLPIGAVTVVLF
ncbi:MAG: hypothetical protein Q4A92_11630, partial [Corynebacterium sp.]|nr:hypothetical protein [Corynebacterium sp.]